MGANHGVPHISDPAQGYADADADPLGSRDPRATFEVARHVLTGYDHSAATLGSGPRTLRDKKRRGRGGGGGVGGGTASTAGPLADPDGPVDGATGRVRARRVGDDDEQQEEGGWHGGAAASIEEKSERRDRDDDDDDDDDKNSGADSVESAGPVVRFVDHWAGNAGIRVHSVSFSGCGLHVYYQNGVADELLRRRVWASRVCSASAGAASALLYLLDLGNYVGVNELLSILPVNSRRPQVTSTTRVFLEGLLLGRYRKNPMHKARHRMLVMLSRVLRRHVPDAHVRVSGRLFITVCHWPSRLPEVVSEFKTLDHLLACLDGTTNIPWVTTRHPTRWGGHEWVDGGFADCHPIIDERTICVSTQKYYQNWSKAWYCKPGLRAEISRPLDPESAHCVYPKRYYRQMVELGRQDAAHFIDRRLLPDLLRNQGQQRSPP